MSPERRNNQGYPFVRGGRNSPITAKIQKIVDRSSNRALPWISAILAGFAAGGVLVICLLKPWEESARRAQAELRAERSQEIADIRAEAKQAGDDAAIWKNRVGRIEAKLEADARK